jgi:FkbM family methyltransferase
MRVFLDIGAHIGETARAVVEFDFDQIHMFEPSQETRAKIDLTDPRLQLHPFGLFSANETRLLYHGRHSYSASIYSDKRNVDAEQKSETIELRRASEWILANLPPDAEIIAKINVEGAEVEILEDLEQASLLPRFRVLVAYPDHRKVPSMKARGRSVFERVMAVHPNVRSSADVMDSSLPTITERTQAWLKGLSIPPRTP